MMGKSFDPSAYFNDVELVHQARAGDNQALETIIETIVKWPSADGTPKLQIYANQRAQNLKHWDAEDIVALMRTIIWKAVMGTGVPSRHWDETRKGTLQTTCFYWLEQDIQKQYIMENRLKKGKVILSNEHVSAAVDSESLNMEDRILLRCTLEKYWKSFDKQKQAIIKGLAQGKYVKEIAMELKISQQTTSWHLRRIRRRLKKRI